MALQKRHCNGLTIAQKVRPTVQCLRGNGIYPARLPNLDPDREESILRVGRRVPFLVCQIRFAVDGIPPPRLLRRAQLRRPFDIRRTINHRNRRAEH